LVRLQILLLDIGQISIGADVTTGNGCFRRQRLVDFSRPRSNALSTGGIDNQVMVFLKPEEAIARQLGKRELEKRKIARFDRFPEQPFDPRMRGLFWNFLARE